MNYTVVTYNDLVNNNYSFLANSYSYFQEYVSIENLQGKYENIFSYFNSMDGFAFPSQNYIPEYIPTSKKIPLVQIGNVNSELCLSQNQKFEFLSIKEAQEKKRFLLSEKGILISLTGGDDVDNNISAFFDNDFKCFLNQRVSFFKLKTDENIDLLYYFYAFTKHRIFNIQWIGSGSIQKNTVARERKKIFIPKINDAKIVKYISLLMQAIINKEKLIKVRHKSIIDGIEKELLENQNDSIFHFEMPRIKELEEIGRLDTGLYNENFKRTNFLVKNYKYGSIDLISRGFGWERGTSLEKNFIRTRIDSDTYIKGFYELVLPTNISQYGFVEKTTYIGTPSKLKTISQGDIIFGGEGFGKGRTYVVIEDSNNVATNYHAIRIINKNNDLTESVFIRCFLAYWREKGMIDYIGVGGSGGHCAPSYFHLIETPLFPKEQQKNVAELYHNEKAIYLMKNWNLDNFLTNDNEFNKTAGISELDKTAKQLKVKLNLAIDNIVNDRQVDIGF